MAPVENPREVEITDVQTARVEGNFTWTLVWIDTDAGVSGTGEMVIGPHADDYVRTAKETIVGESPLDVDARCSELYDRFAHAGGMNGIGVTAVSGIDLALHDLAGKLLGVPAYTLLGGKHRDEVQIYCDSHAGEHAASIDDSDSDPYSPESYAAAAEAVVDDGFEALKFDLDATRRHEGDTRNRHLNARAIEYKASVVEAVTDRVGDRADVAFDCHWNYSPDSAVRLARAIEDYGVLWLEDTVPPESPDVQIRATRESATTIAAGENAYRIEGARRLIEEGGVDVIHPDVPKTGGMYETKKVADLAKAYSVPLALHNVASPVGTVASAHVAAASSNFLALEYHARDVEWWEDLVEEDVLDGDRLPVPDEPGLGVTVDEDVAREHLARGETWFDAA